MKDLRYLNFILTILTVVLALNLYAGFAGGDAAPRAQAQGIPDEGAQNVQIINELKKLNKKADDLNALISSGRIQVRLAAQRGE